jgi:hypothetical protein
MNARYWPCLAVNGGASTGISDARHRLRAHQSALPVVCRPRLVMVRAERGIGFEDVVFHIERGDLLDILEYPNHDRYAGQSIFVVQREGYVYLVPFVEDEHTVFLKTIIPSRKATKEYLGEESDDEDGRWRERVAGVRRAGRVEVC